MSEDEGVDGITNAMDLGKLWEMVRDTESWHTAVHGVSKSLTRLKRLIVHAHKQDVHPWNKENHTQHTHSQKWTFINTFRPRTSDPQESLSLISREVICGG